MTKESLLADHDRRFTQTVIGGATVPREMVHALDGVVVPIPPKAEYRLLAPNERVESVACENCPHAWLKYSDGPAQCPRCNPDQPRPLAVRRQDPNERMGTEWYWDRWKGPGGMWKPIVGMVFTPLNELRPFCDMLEKHGATPGITWIGAATELIERLQRENEELRNPMMKIGPDGVKLLRCDACAGPHGGPAPYYREERGCGLCVERAKGPVLSVSIKPSADLSTRGPALPAIGSRWKHSGANGIVSLPADASRYTHLRQLDGWTVESVGAEVVLARRDVSDPGLTLRFNWPAAGWPDVWSPDEEAAPIAKPADAGPRLGSVWLCGSDPTLWKLHTMGATSVSLVCISAPSRRVFGALAELAGGPWKQVANALPFDDVAPARGCWELTVDGQPVDVGYCKGDTVKVLAAYALAALTSRDPWRSGQSTPVELIIGTRGHGDVPAIPSPWPMSPPYVIDVAKKPEPKLSLPDLVERAVREAPSSLNKEALRAALVGLSGVFNPYDPDPSVYLITLTHKLVDWLACPESQRVHRFGESGGDCLGTQYLRALAAIQAPKQHRPARWTGGVEKGTRSR